MALLRLLLLVMLIVIPLGGCIATLFAVRTVHDIQKSEYRAELESARFVKDVTGCLMETLHAHTTANGKRPYTDLRARGFGRTREIAARAPQFRGALGEQYGGELLFLIENTTTDDGGTRSRLWVHQYMLSPSPQESLDTLASVVKTCL